MNKENKFDFTITRIEKWQPKESYYFIWDSKQDGLGIKIEPTGYKSYVYRYKLLKERRKSFAGYNEINLEEARKIVRDTYAPLVSRGKDPFEVGKLIQDICEEYLQYRSKGEGREKKISTKTAKNWKQIIDCYVKDKPIGKVPINLITPPLADKFMDSLSHIKAQANRIRTFLSLVYQYAIAKGYLDAEKNIWEFVTKYSETPHRPRLAEQELEKLATYLRKAWDGEILDKRGERINPYWISFVLLLYFTGARPNEILTCKWEYIDRDKSLIRLPETKTGKKNIYLSLAAMAVIDSIERKKDNLYLIAGRYGQHLKNYKNAWNTMRQRTGISASIYALRRHFAQLGKEMSEDGDVKLLAKIMGHATEKMTDMYAGESETMIERQRQILLGINEKLGTELEKKIKK